MDEKEILKFAKQQGYDNIIYIGKWREFEVYEPLYDFEDVSYVGLPFMILVTQDTIRMSTPEESLEQINEMD
jgi:hypothetical protein